MGATETESCTHVKVSSVKNVMSQNLHPIAAQISIVGREEVQQPIAQHVPIMLDSAHQANLTKVISNPVSFPRR